MFADGRCGSRGLIRRRDDRGPIFHAKNLQRKDRGASTLCVTAACVVAKQHYLSGILPRIHAGGREKCDQNHSIYMQIFVHYMKIQGAIGA
jgi:hypothetical protein